MTATTTTNEGTAARPVRAAEVSAIRLNGLRLLYLLMALFLLSAVGPHLASAASTHASSVARALLVGLGVMALLGLRYPLKMLPLMLFELAWKLIWLSFYGIPAWIAGNMEPAYASSLMETGIGAIFVVLIVPWKYVFDRYVVERGERWR